MAELMKVVLIDGKNLLFRTHYANVGLSYEGRPTAALYGFIQSMRTLEKHIERAALVVVWESGVLLQRTSASVQNAAMIRNWRYDILAEYKSDRVPNPETANAFAQLPTLVRMIKLLGYKQTEVPGLEADDLICQLAIPLSVNYEVLIYSNDRDFNQMLGRSPRIKLLRPNHAANGGPPFKVYTEKELKAEFGVSPDDWCKLRALSGDPSDHIKALKGIGPKKALELLSLGVDPTQTSPIDLPKYRELLEANWEKVRACYQASVIPTSLKALPMPREVLEYARLEVQRIQKCPYRRMSEEDIEQCKTRLLGIFADHGLRAFIADIDKLFLNVKN